MVDLQQGEIIFENDKVLGPSFNLIPGHSEMKLVSQENRILENHTVKENIADCLSGYTNEYKIERIDEVLKAVDLKKFSQKKANLLSSGQRQRLSIARAIAEFPKLLLLDEPFSNLDFSRRDLLFTFIRKNLKQNKSSCIYITHHPNEAIRYADQLIIMEEGKIMEQNHPEKIYKQPKSVEIAKLFGSIYLIDKKLFSNVDGMICFKEKCLIRPEQLYLSTEKKKSVNISATVETTFFSGYRYDIQVRLANKKIICFNHHEPLPEKKKIVLSVLV